MRLLYSLKMVFKHQFPYSILLIVLALSFILFILRPQPVDVVGVVYLSNHSVNVIGYAFNYHGNGVPITVEVNGVKDTTEDGIFHVMINEYPKYNETLIIDFVTLHKTVKINLLSDYSTFSYISYAKTVNEGSELLVIIDGKEIIVNSTSIIERNVNYYSIPYEEIVIPVLMISSFALSTVSAYKILSPFPRKYYLILTRIGVDMVIPSLVALVFISLLTPMIVLSYVLYYHDFSLFQIIPYNLAYSLSLSSLSLLGSKNMLRLSPTIAGYVLSVYLDHLPEYLLLLSLISPIILYFKKITSLE